MMTRSQKEEADLEPAKTMWKVSLMQRSAGKVLNEHLFGSVFFYITLKLYMVPYFHGHRYLCIHNINRFIKAYKKFGSPLER